MSHDRSPRFVVSTTAGIMFRRLIAAPLISVVAGFQPASLRRREGRLEACYHWESASPCTIGRALVECNEKRCSERDFRSRRSDGHGRLASNDRGGDPARATGAVADAQACRCGGG